MTFGQTLTPQEVANHLRSEFGTGNPKVRLSMITYLMENEVRPTPDDVDDFIIMVDKLVTWTAADADTFFDNIASMPSTEATSDEQQTETETVPRDGRYL